MIRIASTPLIEMGKHLLPQPGLFGSGFAFVAFILLAFGRFFLGMCRSFRFEGSERPIDGASTVLLFLAVLTFSPLPSHAQVFEFSGNASGGTFDYDGDGSPDGTW